jgi:hypothetical protein
MKCAQRNCTGPTPGRLKPELRTRWPVLRHALPVVVLAAFFATLPLAAADPPGVDPAKMLAGYFEQMSLAKPFIVRTGAAWEQHRKELMDYVLECTGLNPLPARVPLDVHQTPPLDHPWCTVRRVYYRLWPGVYSSGLLFMPKQLRERPAPAMLCPHGHWSEGNAHPDVQKRCLNFARLGYVTFSSTQNHYEDLALGISHQTLMIWNNMRALDYLESLPEVNKARLGAAGESGGGLQTQMLTALDSRVKAATIVGLTCNFREIMFPDSTHCVCNHFPGIMQRTDHPEISALGLPTPVQYLTMNDWTRTFEANNFPTIRKLYAADSNADRVFCKYFDTAHNYDQTKREFTYWWMERWLRNQPAAAPEGEPDTQTFPVATLQKLTVAVPEDKGFAEISRLYRAARGYTVPRLGSVAEWQAHRQRMMMVLRELLGESAVLPRRAAPISQPPQADGDLLIERTGYPSEGGIVVPSVVLRAKTAKGRLPVVVVLAAEGPAAALGETGPDSPRRLAQDGSLLVLPELRGYGELLATSKNPAGQRLAWERNGIVWGRPLPGLGATDLRGVLDGIAARPDADLSRLTLISRRSGGLAVAGLFTAALDPRVTAADLDLAGGSFEKRNLPLVPSVLRHGDVLSWAALLADRKLILRHVPPEAGDPAWLKQVFTVAGNPAGVQINP